MATEIVTIAVPQGTSNHGDASLICAEARWYHVITFLFGNYITQSATIATRPGENVATTLKGLLLALFFPTTGIVRGIRAILQFALRRKTSLGAATGAGAMCVVVRSEEWLPQHGDHINFVKLETVKTEEPFVSKPFAMFNRAVGPKSFSVKFEGIEMDDLR